MVLFLKIPLIAVYPPTLTYSEINWSSLDRYISNPECDVKMEERVWSGPAVEECLGIHLKFHNSAK
jgi:hypothetical protein